MKGRTVKYVKMVTSENVFISHAWSCDIHQHIMTSYGGSYLTHLYHTDFRVSFCGLLGLPPCRDVEGVVMRVQK